MDNFSGYSSVVKPKRNPLVIVAIVLGVLALVSAIVLVVNILSKNDTKNKTETYTVSEVRKSVNKYAHFLIDGDEKDESKITEDSDDNETTNLDQMLQTDMSKEGRKDFVKNASKFSKDSEHKLAHVEGNKIKKAEEYRDMLEDVRVEIKMINTFLNTDFEPKDYLEEYQKNKTNGVYKAMIKNYEDVSLYYDLVHVADHNPKDGEEYIDYIEIASDTEKIMADFYKTLIDYSEAVNNLLILYDDRDCIGSRTLRATCKEIVDESDVGKSYIEEQGIALQTMLDKVAEARKDAIFVVKDIAQKINK